MYLKDGRGLAFNSLIYNLFLIFVCESHGETINQNNIYLEISHSNEKYSELLTSILRNTIAINQLIPIYIIPDKKNK